jgi:hypothetical protein
MSFVRLVHLAVNVGREMWLTTVVALNFHVFFSGVLMASCFVALINKAE